MRYAKRTTRYPLEQVARKIEDILKQYIMDEWYGRMNPEDYSRTYNFVNSISVKPTQEIKDGWMVEIYFDNEKIFPEYADEDRTWNKHMSVYGEDVSDYIPEWIERGNNSPIYNYKGVHMMQNTFEYCEKYNIPIKEMIKELKKYGFNVK
jgi:predicted RNA binding protein YcfA (HicA-like mRNA interferase family)